MFVTGSALPVTDLARACEERGLESLWVPEHPVVPARHATRYPLSDDGKLPRPYTELPDCFATLAAAAGVTRRLRLGTGICLVPERDPLLTAHQVATLDWLSGGRFLFGVGAGWLREEMDLFTPHFPYRFAFMREAVAAMRKLWTEDAPSFEGKWVRFPPAVCRPKPGRGHADPRGRAPRRGRRVHRRAGCRASGEGPAAGRGRGRRRADSLRSVTRDCRARERGHRLRFDSAPLDTGPGATDPCGGRWRHPARRRRIEAETAPPPPRTAVSGHTPSLSE